MRSTSMFQLRAALFGLSGFIPLVAATESLVTRLSNYSTCDISDGLGKLGYADGGFLPGLKMFSPDILDEDIRIVGPAYTVEYSFQSDPAPEISCHYIDSIPEGAVIFISSPADIHSAVYGGLMSARAKYSKAAGTIIDGRFRDLKKHRDLDWPVNIDLKVTAINGALSLRSSPSNATVRPGDYIVADLNGVVVLPQELAEEALPLMEKAVAANLEISEALLKGMRFVEARDKFRD